ncbi:hypothetical protein [Mesorhizobium sp.]|uniref:hypothetical protein n=1 Tax=Mesorhizobium sp. TaxID=1871066 RepID=UPI000FE66AF2|nr:hypothetical protein [Mesorhizobium sp.]RWP63835.1 MAG: hypothetical protein EOR08_10175 [Mesorhizobium sp.]
MRSARNRIEDTRHFPNVASNSSASAIGSSFSAIAETSAGKSVCFSYRAYRDREVDLEIVEEGRPWSFDGGGAFFRLVSEAQRIYLAQARLKPRFIDG